MYFCNNKISIIWDFVMKIHLIALKYQNIKNDFTFLSHSSLQKRYVRDFF